MHLRRTKTTQPEVKFVSETSGRRPTLKEVARAAGVSVASASYAINGTGSVGEQTREHILAVAAQLGYRPNLSAKAMKTGRTGTLGLVVPDLTNPFFPSLAQVIIQTARQNGYSVLLTDTEGSPDAERQSLQLLSERGVDGVIWFPVSDDSAVGEAIGGTPTVVLDRNLAGYDVVHADYAQGGELAARRLIAAGHTRIGVISGPVAASSARQRAEAAVEVIKTGAHLAWQVSNAFSLDLEPAVIAAIDSREATAIVVGADLIAIGAIRHLHASGLRVPEDVSIIGFDDIPWAPLNTPPLSTIEMPSEEMALEAVELLLRRIAQPDEPRRRVVFNVGLIERASVGPPPR